MNLKRLQGEWLQMMPRKLMFSLALTPLTDKLLMSLFGVKKSQKSTDSLYDIAHEMDQLTPQQRLESVEQLILLFKTCMVMALYYYSA